MLTRTRGFFILAMCLSLFGCARVVEEESAEGTGDPSSAAGGTPGDPSIDPKPAPEGCNGVLEVPDPALAAGLREQLGLGADDPIPGAAVAALDSLHLGGLGIENLSGLECATSIEQLFLQGNRIEDVSVLARLPRLYNLHLNENRIVSLGALSGHPGLRTLKADDNLVSSTRDLNDLSELQNLSLSGNPLEALEGLGGTHALFHLSVDRTHVGELSSLSRFPVLNNANFTDTQVTSLATLPDLHSLTTLILDDAEVEDVSLGAVLPALENLHLNGNHIASLAGLDPATVPNLKHLGLARNPLTDTSQLASHPQLVGVTISEVGAGGADLSWVTGLPDLASLEARSNSITDLTPLAGARRVYMLDLSDNLIEDASPLNDVDFIRCARVSLTGNPGEGSFGGVLDALCARVVEVSGYCTHAECDPCANGGCD
jgi:Leucine-rich repeat (LRR) protein